MLEKIINSIKRLKDEHRVLFIAVCVSVGILGVGIFAQIAIAGARFAKMSELKSNAPVIRSAKIANGNTYLTWEKVPGASHYEILEYDKDTDKLRRKWNVGETDSSKEWAEYSDGSYSVRPYFGNERGMDSDKVHAEANAPEITSCEISAGDFNEIKLEWEIKGGLDKEDGTRFRISRQSGKEKAEVLEEDFVGDSYIDESTECGGKYKYSIEAYNDYEDHTVVSKPFDTSQISVPDKKVNISSVSNTSYGVSGKVSDVDGANCYKIFKKKDDGKWKKLAVIEGREFVDVEASGTIEYRALAGRVYDDEHTIWGKKGGKQKKIKVDGTGQISAKATESSSNATDSGSADSTAPLQSYPSSPYGSSGIGAPSASTQPVSPYVSTTPSASVSNEPTTDSAGRHPIMGSNGVTVDQMVSYFNSIGGEYPSVYASKGAPTIREFAQIVFDVCAQYGIRDEIVFAQVCLETGNLGFHGSSVDPEQCNFSGLGATGGGVSGNSFSSVQEGITAQVQHLRLYADPSYTAGSDNVDKRYEPSLAGNAPYVEYLEVGKNPNGGGWAVGDGYAEKILTIVDKIKSQ